MRTKKTPLIVLSGVFIVLGLVWLVFFVRKNWHYATEFTDSFKKISS